MTLSIQVSVGRSASVRHDEMVVQHGGEELRFFLYRRPGDAGSRVRLGFTGPLSFRVLRLERVGGDRRDEPSDPLLSRPYTR